MVMVSQPVVIHGCSRVPSQLPGCTVSELAALNATVPPSHSSTASMTLKNSKVFKKNVDKLTRSSAAAATVVMITAVCPTEFSRHSFLGWSVARKTWATCNTRGVWPAIPTMKSAPAKSPSANECCGSACYYTVEVIWSNNKLDKDDWHTLLQVSITSITSHDRNCCPNWFYPKVLADHVFRSHGTILTMYANDFQISSFAVWEKTESWHISISNIHDKSLKHDQHIISHTRDKILSNTNLAITRAA